MYLVLSFRPGHKINLHASNDLKRKKKETGMRTGSTSSSSVRRCGARGGRSGGCGRTWMIRGGSEEGARWRSGTWSRSS